MMTAWDVLLGSNTILPKDNTATLYLAFSPLFEMSSLFYSSFVQMVQAASSDFDCTGYICFSNSPCTNYYYSLKPLNFNLDNGYQLTIPP
jgi:hypothetical protein